MQRTSTDPARTAGVLAQARRLRLVTASAGCVAVAAGVFAIGEPGAVWIALACGYELTHALELSATVFKNRIAWGVPVAARAFASLARLAIVVALLLADVHGAAAYVLGTAVGSSLANVILHFAARPHLPPPADAKERARAGGMRALWSATWPLGVAGLCQQLYFYVDNVFVRVLEGDAELGRYNVAVRLLSFLIMGAQFATVSALPWLARRPQAERGAAAARLAQPLFAGACLGAGLVWPWSEALLRFLFGEGFGSAAASLRWLLLAAATIYAGAPLLWAVVAAGRPRAVLAVTAAALAVNLAGNAVLIPRLGIEGAALATLATEGAVAIGAFVSLALAGARPLAARPLGWLAGPLAFGVGRGVAALMAG